MKLITLLFLCITINSTWAGEDNVYDFSWLDGDKEIYVLQNRKFRKKSRVYLGGLYGRSINGAFIDSSRFSLQGGFFFQEDWGLELSYVSASGSTNTTHDSVKEQSNAVAFYRKIETEMTAMLLWSPFYSKINTFNKIFYYDWMFGLGVSTVTTADNRNEFDDASPDSDKLTNETNSGVSWMTAFRFYITENWSSELRFRATHVNADYASENQSNQDTTEKRWIHYYNFNVGLNYTF
jgi:outer membrane beta-barrel protein